MAHTPRAPAEDHDSTGTGGLSTVEAQRRRARSGPNAVRTHRVSALAVLARQLRSALLGLLLVAAAVSFFVGQRTDAVVIGVILAVSVGVGFVNEYRAERAGAALHDRIRHATVVTRDEVPRSVDVVDLVPGGRGARGPGPGWYRWASPARRYPPVRRRPSCPAPP